MRTLVWCADMNNEPKELKPCPFCGSSAMLVVINPPTYNCTNYNCKIGRDIEFTAEQWQTRATPDVSEIVEILHKLRDGDHVGTAINKNTAAMYLIEEAIAKATKTGGVE